MSRTADGTEARMNRHEEVLHHSCCSTYLMGELPIKVGNAHNQTATFNHYTFRALHLVGLRSEETAGGYTSKMVPHH